MPAAKLLQQVNASLYVQAVCALVGSVWGDLGAV